jgi:hypothetical protein
LPRRFGAGEPAADDDDLPTQILLWDRRFRLSILLCGARSQRAVSALMRTPVQEATTLSSVRGSR